MRASFGMDHPLLYEVNTRCWLAGLAARLGRPLSLAEIPPSEFELWRSMGCSHLWLMGVWPGGPEARAHALGSPELRRLLDDSFPGWSEEDVGASPYAVAGDTVCPTLGGNQALRRFRRRLHANGLKLLLDFVPNHLGLDHPWVRERPELFVNAPSPRPGVARVMTAAGERWLAHGRDPFFPPWTDTFQLDYRRPEVRSLMTEWLLRLADLCDGVRCDMAMLLLNEVFRSTWSDFPVSFKAAPGEFWAHAIREVRRRHPGFLFLAEAYWGREMELLRLGFDFAYDKEALDHLVARNHQAFLRHVRDHVRFRLEARAHFLENHDEERAAARFSLAEQRSYTATLLALPGLCLLHQGQLSGAMRRLPVQLRRDPLELGAPVFTSWFEELLRAFKTSCIRQGDYRFPEVHDPNGGSLPVFAVLWQDSSGRQDLLVTNLDSQSHDVRVRFGSSVSASGWRVRDRLWGPCSERGWAVWTPGGLAGRLTAHDVHFLELRAANRG